MAQKGIEGQVSFYDEDPHAMGGFPALIDFDPSAVYDGDSITSWIDGVRQHILSNGLGEKDGNTISAERTLKVGAAGISKVTVEVTIFELPNVVKSIGVKHRTLGRLPDESPYPNGREGVVEEWAADFSVQPNRSVSVRTSGIIGERTGLEFPIQNEISPDNGLSRAALMPASFVVARSLVFPEFPKPSS